MCGRDPSPAAAAEPVWGGGLRIFWILACMLILPQPLARLGLSPVWCVTISGAAGLTAVFPLSAMGCRRPSGADMAISVAAGIGIILLSGAATLAAKYVLTALDLPFAERQPLARLIGESSRREALMLGLSVCVLTPMIEEVLFRRLIYGLWHKWHPRSAFWGGALIFAAVHFFPIGFPGLFLMGCGFQWLALARRNLTCAMIAHGVVNAFAFAVNFYAKG